METYPVPQPTSFLPSAGRQARHEYVVVGALDAPEPGVLSNSGKHDDANAPGWKHETDSLLSASSGESNIKEAETSREKPPHDPFRPFPEIEGLEEQKNPLTFRAIFLGIFFGTLVNAAELYAGR